MSVLPKSRVLQARVNVPAPTIGDDLVDTGYGGTLRIPVQIKPIETFNDFIYLIHLQAQPSAVLVKTRQMLPEGIVIGIPQPGHGMSDGNGGRLPSQLRLGDHVMFPLPNIIQSVAATDGYYKDYDIIVISERNIMAKLAPIPFEIVGDEAASCGVVE